MDMKKYNICYPGRIIEFDEDRQLASVQLAIEKLFMGRNYSYDSKKQGLLLDVPVQFPQGGGWDITFPVKAGDDCMIWFCHRGYDHWLYEDRQEAGMVFDAPAPDHNRCLALQDAVCIVGFRPIAKAISSFSTDGMDIRNEGRDQRISLKQNNDIEIETPTRVNVTANNSVSITATNEVSITAPTINLNGNVNISGNLNTSGTSQLTGAVTASGSVSGASGTFGGKSVEGHTHNLGDQTTTTPN